MTPKFRPINPQPNVEYLVDVQPIEMKRQEIDGVGKAYKFIFDNGAVLYVPLPVDHGEVDEICVAITSGSMSA
jgi:hypothetical protein